MSIHAQGDFEMGDELLEAWERISYLVLGIDPRVMKQCVHTTIENLGVRLVTVIRKANHCLSQRTAPHPSPAANQLPVVVNNIHELHHR